MTLFKRSVWYYGHTITQSNRAIDFDEGGSEISANLRVGSYSLTGFANEVARTLNLNGENTYTASVDRNTRQITISADANFSLLAATGTSVQNVYSLLGFTTDQTGGSSYTGTASGLEYAPTVRLQDYNDFERDQESVDALVNTTASGRVESVTFGRNKFMTCNIRYQSDKRLSFAVNNSNAVNDLIDFMEYITTKAIVEFMPDINDRSDFREVVLESTSASSSGTGFRLRESDGVPGIYDTGRLRFRERVT